MTRIVNASRELSAMMFMLTFETIGQNEAAETGSSQHACEEVSLSPDGFDLRAPCGARKTVETLDFSSAAKRMDCAGCWTAIDAWERD
jgi:hypothetical protein